MIFITQDVGEDREILTFKDKTHCDTRNRTLDRHACVHHGEASTANRRHRRRAVRFCNVAGQTDCVRELVLGWQHGVQRTPCKLTMAHFAATGRTETANFTNAVRWEVVMQHEVFIMQTAKTVDHLLCVLGAQGAGCDGLRFAACEQGRTMCAWQEMRFRNDWTDLRGAATVDAGAVLQDCAANDFSFKLLHQLASGKLILRRRVNKRFFRLCACNVQRVAAFGLVGQLIGCSNILADQLLKLVLRSGQVSLLRHCPRILGSLFSKLDDCLDDFLTCVMRKQDGTKHDFFRKLIGFGFNHHHRVICRCNNEV